MPLAISLHFSEEYGPEAKEHNLMLPLTVRIKQMGVCNKLFEKFSLFLYLVISIYFIMYL